MRFELQLAQAENKGLQRRSTTLHLMIAIALFGLGAGSGMMFWYTHVAPAFRHAYLPLGIFSGVAILSGLSIAAITIRKRSWMMQGRNSQVIRVIEVLLMAAAATVFAFAGQYKGAGVFGIVAICLLAAAIYEGMPNRDSDQIIIDEEGISLPKSGYTKRYSWDEIERLLLRHGILSVELSGNKLLQRELRSEAADAAGLESFAKSRIAAHSKERAAKASW